MDQPDQVHLKKSTDKISIRAPSNGCCLAYIRSLVADLARKVGFPDDEIAKIEMAVDEACSNVVEHAYAGKEESPAPTKIWQWKRRDPGIRLDVGAERDRLVIEINDHGKRFDFSTYQPKNMEERIRQMETGGYGVAIMREFMDEVQYSSSDTAGNTLRLVKYLKKT
jgi:serine/threonine-protein kinase RsbW